MTADIRRRLKVLEGGASVDLASQPGDSPIVASILATAHFVRQAIGRPNESPIDVLARVYGLRNGRSLKPWLERSISDVEELARLDFEPTHGDRWRDEWQRRQDDAFAMLEMHVGPDWPAVLRDHQALATRMNGRSTVAGSFRQPNFSEANGPDLRQ